MEYALANFRVYLLGDRPFIVYSYHASLRTAVNSPHLSQRMARWLSFFAENHVSIEYKPERINVVADTLSHRFDIEKAAPPDTGPTTVVVLTSSVPSTLLKDIREAYDPGMMQLIQHLSHSSGKSLKQLSSLYLSSKARYKVRNGLLQYSAVGDTPRVVVPDHSDLRLRIMYEYHDAPVGGHRCR